MITAVNTLAQVDRVVDQVEEEVVVVADHVNTCMSWVDGLTYHSFIVCS